MALDIRALARAMYDPRQFPGAYSDEKRRLRGLEANAYAAQFADPRSVVAQNSPFDPRSIAAQQMPGLFGPQALAAQQQQQQAPTPEINGVDDMMRTSYRETYNGRGTSKKKRFSYKSEI